MKLPLSWLKDYVDIDISAQELAKKLLNCGFEVEEIICKGEGIENVVVGKILSVKKHPNADKLLICEVFVGDKSIQVVTGAQNVKAGDTVPVALHGATLHGGIKIKEGKLRGELSQGMLCSGEELGITDADYEGASADGILIIKEGEAPGTDIKKVLGLDEYVLDVSVTANRPDCQSVYGIAREVAALLDKPLKPLDLHFEEDKGDSIEKHIDVEVLAPDLCPRYMAKYVKDIEIFESPSWMKRRLALCGLRPINAIVDITNYVLLEVGQPMHAFDYRFLEGSKIIVRRANPGEKITTLNEKENALNDEMLVICDAKKPVALAGIMGGENSGIREDTRDIVFEAAKFARDSIRRTSRKLSIQSDSSARFEKGVDAALCETAMKRSLALVYQLKCGKIISGIKDICAEKMARKVITVEKEKIDKLLGICIEKEAMLKILNALEFKASFEKDVLLCEVPIFREDIDGYPDLAEEIIRYYGYDHLVATLLKNASITKGGKSSSHKHSDRLKDVMAAQGFNEIITYSFIPQEYYDKLKLEENDPLRNAISLLNPLSEKMALMRTTLVPSLIDTVAGNTRKKMLSGRLFELANVYIPKSLPLESLPDERPALAFALFGEGEDFFTAKGCVENIAEYFGLELSYERGSYSFMHGGRCADIFCGGEKIGFFGEVHPDVLEEFDIRQRIYIGEIDYRKLEKNIRYYKGFKPIPKFPEVDRDIAIIVSEDATCGQLLDTIRRKGGALLKEAQLFDCYIGGQIEKGKKSMAFSLRFGAEDRTLKVEEVDQAIERILKALGQEHGAVLR